MKAFVSQSLPVQMNYGERCLVAHRDDIHRFLMIDIFTGKSSELNYFRHRTRCCQSCTTGIGQTKTVVEGSRRRYSGSFILCRNAVQRASSCRFRKVSSVRIRITSGTRFS
jgi:hypothetical protein